MKLDLGKNLRDLRKAADMTQEELANRLGVSYQSVSRWETGTTYPDMEFLPAIAAIFSVSADILLGIPQEQKDEKARETLEALRRASLKPLIDPEEVNDLIREIRRNYLNSGYIWEFWISGNDNCYSHPEVLPEVRLTAEAFLERTKDPFLHNSALETMAIAEDEEHIMEFLDRYASELDISKSALLYKRYYRRNDRDAFEVERQHRLFALIDDLCDSRNYFELSQPGNVRQSLETYMFLLNTLNSFCGIKPNSEYPVSGNGELDFWIVNRLDLGFRCFCYLASTGDKEHAFIMLEDCVCLLENIMGITETITLSCTSPWIRDSIWQAEPSWHNKNNNPDGSEERIIYIHHKYRDGVCCYCVFPSTYYHILTAEHDWNGFDSIRQEPRYQACVDRVKTLIVTR